MSKSIVWFRKDLRLHDNPVLINAIRNSEQILPIYIFDPMWFDKGMFSIDRIGKYRTRFLWESVRSLRSNFRSLDSEIVVRSGNPKNILSDICERNDIDTVYAQTIPSTQEMKREKEVKQEIDAEFNSYWTHTLHHIDDLKTSYKNMEDTFTPWRKETQYEVDVRETYDAPKKLDTVECVTKEGQLPDPDEFGLSSDNSSSKSFIEFKGGESEGLERVNNYIWKEDKLREYKETRNGLLGRNYSSKFSPWLAHGCISPRRIYEEVQEYEEERVSNDSTYWLVFELMWRDFFQFQFMKYKSQFYTQSGIRNVEYDWNQNLELFRSWADARTGIPFVDANMRELNETGFMSNRGRQNVASFLVDVLNVDWRIGAMYFQSKLVDYDVCSNWGNWAYIAGVGNDSREDRYFNVIKQAKKYDENGEYVRHWIPELSNLPVEATHQPWLLSKGQQQIYCVELGEDYPNPIVDIQNNKYKDIVKN